MIEQDKEFFCQVCLVVLMQNGGGILTKSPKYIKEKATFLRLIDPLAAWQELNYANRALLLTWADSWNVPMRDWIKEIGGEI